MPGVIRDFQRGLKPVTWPQDTLQVPRGHGRMPAVDTLNSKRTRREYFSYTGEFTNLVSNAIASINIPIAKDGDFWISSISMFGFSVFGGVLQQSLYLDGNIQITDVLDQYQMFVPSMPIPSLLISVADLNFTGITTGIPLNITNNIIEPYPVLRGGVLKVDITTGTVRASGSPNTLQIAFNGWKEYANAAT
jgi:hypothetical protein